MADTGKITLLTPGNTEFTESIFYSQRLALRRVCGDVPDCRNKWTKADNRQIAHIPTLSKSRAVKPRHKPVSWILRWVFGPISLE
jgi:hypothetical protein